MIKHKKNKEKFNEEEVIDVPKIKTPEKIDLLVNLVNISDVVDSPNTNTMVSNVVLVSIEPNSFTNLTIEGNSKNIVISKDHEGNYFINNKKVRLVDLGNGIKVLAILREEYDIDDLN